MFYLPDEWLVNKSNSEKVHDIINERFFSDIITEDTPTIEEIADKLRDIGETTVAKKLIAGEIVIGG